MAFNPNLIIPDISFWQDNNNTPALPDFQKMKSAGAVGVIIRAGQNTWVDEDFRVNWRAAKEAGLLRGAYWFYDSRNLPMNQASLFINIVGDDLPELGYWLDLEENYGGTYRGWQNWQKCLNALSSIRDNVGIYTAPAYWKANRPTDHEALLYFARYPLWIAHYGVSHPEIPAPWSLGNTWFWQFTSKGDGAKYGVESLSIDLNYFNGTTEDFYAKFTGGNVPPSEGESMLIVGKALTPVNLRDAVWGNIIGYLNTGDTIEADSHNFQWLHITKINGQPTTRETWASAGSKQQYIQWEVIPEPEPEPTPEPVKVVKGVFFNEDGTSFEMYPAE